MGVILLIIGLSILVGLLIAGGVWEQARANIARGLFNKSSWQYVKMEEKRDERMPNFPFKPFLKDGIFFTLIIALLFCLIVCVPAYFVNKNRSYSFTPFYRYNSGQYTEVVEELKEGVPVDFTDESWFDSANLQQIDAFGTALSDRRDVVINYNKGVYHYKQWENSFWDGLLRPNIPDDVTYIER